LDLGHILPLISCVIWTSVSKSTAYCRTGEKIKKQIYENYRLKPYNGTWHSGPLHLLCESKDPGYFVSATATASTQQDLYKGLSRHSEAHSKYCLHVIPKPEKGLKSRGDCRDS
jgi:hypothetical protein